MVLPQLRFLSLGRCTIGALEASETSTLCLETRKVSVFATVERSADETGQISVVETRQMSAVETGQMSPAETGHMSAVETRKMH